MKNNHKYKNTQVHINTSYNNNASSKMGVQVHFKGGNTIGRLLVAPKDKNNMTQKSGVKYMYRCDWLECDEGYIGESAMTSVKGLRKISGILPLHMTMPPLQVIIPGWKVSPWWIGTLKTLQEPLRKPYISGSMIHPSTGTLGSFKLSPSGLRSCSVPQTYNPNRPFHNSDSYCAWWTPHCGWQEAHSLCQYLTAFCRYVVLHQ